LQQKIAKVGKLHLDKGLGAAKQPVLHAVNQLLMKSDISDWDGFVSTLDQSSLLAINYSPLPPTQTILKDREEKIARLLKDLNHQFFQNEGSDSQVFYRRIKSNWKNLSAESTKLDFIHLNINKKQGKLQQTPGQEVAHAYPANRIYHDLGSLCAAVLQAHLGTCEDFAHWSYLVSCRANGDCGSASDGLEWRKAFSELSSSSQSSSLFKLGGQSYFVGSAYPCICAARSDHPGAGRYDRTTSRS
jgi:hypothetical protein